MLGISLAIGNQAVVSSGGGGGFASDALALDFKNGAYWQGGTNRGALSSVPGYAYSRVGAKAELTATGISSPFAANVPAIVSGLGYYSEAAFTNNLLQSQTFENAAWVPANVTVSANALVAPDGTTTADLLTVGGASAAYLNQSTTTTAGSVTTSIIAKAGTGSYIQICDDHDGAGGSYCNFDLTNGVVGTASGHVGKIEALGSGWYRCSVALTALAQTDGVFFVVIGSPSGGRANAPAGGATVYFWHAQEVAASVPGPVLVTTSATASAAADSLAVTVPNGTYTATYTFSDNSTQTIPTTISGTTFTLPLYPATLSKLPISLVTLV